MYISQNVTKPAGISPGSAAAKEPNVAIFDVDDILFFPPRDSKGITHMGDFVMKPGKHPVLIYMTKSKISAPYESDGDEDSINIKQSFEGQHPGNKVEIREFIQNWLGRNVIVVHGSCSEPEREVVGTPCAPLQLKPSKQDNNDGRFHMLKFEAFATSQFLPGLYNGVLPTATPFNVADAEDIAVTAANGHQYQLPALAITAPVSVTSTDLVTGDSLTVIGGGGAAPATIASGVSGVVTILLKDGTTWTGLSGAVINFKVFDGGVITYLIEQSRS